MKVSQTQLDHVLFLFYFIRLHVSTFLELGRHQVAASLLRKLYSFIQYRMYKLSQCFDNDISLSKH